MTDQAQTTTVPAPAWLDRFSLMATGNWTFLSHGNGEDIGRIEITLDDDGMRALIAAWQQENGHFVIIAGSLGDAVSNMIDGTSDAESSDFLAWADFLEEQARKMRVVGMGA